jgi:hypothetical protein
MADKESKQTPEESTRGAEKHEIGGFRVETGPADPLGVRHLE